MAVTFGTPRGASGKPVLCCAPVSAERTIRLPLQTGTSALQLWTRGVVLTTLALALVVGLVLLLVHVGLAVLPHVFVLGSPVVLGLGFTGLGFLRKAPRARASDVALSPEGLRIEGGPHAWAYRDPMGWAAIAGDDWRVREPEEPAGKGATCLYAGPESEEISLAEAKSPEEVISVRQLAETLGRVARRRASPQSEPATGGPTMLRCARCGSPVPGADAPEQRCAHCGSSVPVPEGVRERVRAARRVASSAKVTPQLVQRVLEQPRAKTSNVVLLVGAAAMVALVPAAVWMGVELSLAGKLGLAGAIGLVLLPVSLFWAVYGLLYSILVRRRAVGLVALRLGASPVAGAAGGHACRNCSAPLPAAEAGIVVSCEYCAAPNVLGLDLRAEAETAASQEQELQDDLVTADLRRARARRQLYAAVVAVVASAALFVFGLGS